MFVDLHAHYPMHLPASSRITPPRPHPTPGDAIRALVLDVANRVANFPDAESPGVTIETLRTGGVGVALSVLYLPFDEMDLSKRYKAPPAADYFEDLEGLIDEVEASIAKRPQADAVVARNRTELEAGLAAGQQVLIHAIEGGFHIGHNQQAVRDNVRKLAGRGVAYITVAHLFYRRVARNAPALPFLSDGLYKAIFPQTGEPGLTPLGRALIEAMVEERILIDVTHMSRGALQATMRYLDQLDPGKSVPVIATHGAYAFGKAEYNLTDRQLRAIAARSGVVGLIMCSHWMADGLRTPRKLDESLKLISKHIDAIRKATGSDDVVAIGTDYDGFIKPALKGLDSPSQLGELEKHLRSKHAAVADRIMSGNARRILDWWRGTP